MRTRGSFLIILLVFILFINGNISDIYAASTNSAWGAELAKLKEQLAALEDEIRQLAQNIIKLDMAIASPDTNTTSVLHNNNDTNILARFDLIHDRLPRVITAGDLNNDSHQDIVVGNAEFSSGVIPNSVSVLLGNGNGTFSAMLNATAPFTARFPVGIEVLDIVGDSNQDVVVLMNRKTIELFKGNGTGNLSHNQTITLSDTPWAFSTGDIDNDGITDLVVVSSSTNGFFTIINHTGSNITANDIPVVDSGGDAVRVISHAIANFTADSNSDIVTVSDFHDKILIYQGNGAGSFTFLSEINTEQFNESPKLVAAADFNNDTKTDIAVIDSNEVEVFIHLGNGDGTFDSPQAYSTILGIDDIEIADITINGRLDIAMLSRSEDSVQVLLGNGDGTFIPRFFEFGVKGDPRDLVLVDLDTLP